MDTELIEARQQFLRDRKNEAANAGQMVALQLLCGIDLGTALRAGREEGLKTMARIERAIERERRKGLCRHWSYDLNRHIALKQALDRLRGTFLAPAEERNCRNPRWAARRGKAGPEA